MLSGRLARVHALTRSRRGRCMTHPVLVVIPKSSKCPGAKRALKGTGSTRLQDHEKSGCRVSYALFRRGASVSPLFHAGSKRHSLLEERREAPSFPCRCRFGLCAKIDPNPGPYNKIVEHHQRDEARVSKRYQMRARLVSAFPFPCVH